MKGETGGAARRGVTSCAKSGEPSLDKPSPAPKTSRERLGRADKSDAVFGGNNGIKIMLVRNFIFYSIAAHRYVSQARFGISAFFGITAAALDRRRAFVTCIKSLDGRRAAKRGERYQR